MKFTRKMKKLFITSAVLAVIGVLLCIFGLVTAAKNGEQIFSQSQNEQGQYIYMYEFDASMIKKISLELTYADVNLYKSGDVGRIEMINYPLDKFGMTVGATTLSVKEKSALGSLFSLNFDGLRNYFNSAKMATKSRTVNIYLPEEVALKLLEVELFSGDVRLEQLRAETDFEIDLKYGSVVMNDIISTGSFSVKIAEGNMNVDNSVMSAGSSELKYGYMEIAASDITEIEANISKGYFKYESTGTDLLSSVIRLKTDNGRVRFVDDIYENGSFSQGIEYTGASGVVQNVINVNVGEGNIMVR